MKSEEHRAINASMVLSVRPLSRIRETEQLGDVVRRIVDAVRHDAPVDGVNLHLIAKQVISFYVSTGFLVRSDDRIGLTKYGRIAFDEVRRKLAVALEHGGPLLLETELPHDGEELGRPMSLDEFRAWRRRKKDEQA